MEKSGKWKRKKKQKKRDDGIWEGRKSKNDWHFGNCLVRTESSRELQIPRRSSFSLYARTLIKALRKYVYDNIQRVRTCNAVVNARAITGLLRVRGASSVSSNITLYGTQMELLIKIVDFKLLQNKICLYF